LLLIVDRLSINKIIPQQEYHLQKVKKLIMNKNQPLRGQTEINHGFKKIGC